MKKSPSFFQQSFLVGQRSVLIFKDRMLVTHVTPTSRATLLIYASQITRIERLPEKNFIEVTYVGPDRRLHRWGEPDAPDDAWQALNDLMVRAELRFGSAQRD